MRANTRVCNQDTKGILSQNPAQLSGLLGLWIPHEQRKKGWLGQPSIIKSQQ